MTTTPIEEIGERLFTEPQACFNVLQAAKKAVLVASVAHVLHAVQRLEFVLDVLIDALEALCVLRQLSLYLFGTNEQRLQVGPSPLYFVNDEEAVGHIGELKLPFLRLLLKLLDETRREHALYGQLIALQSLEILLRQLEQRHVRALVEVVEPLDGQPALVQTHEGVFDLELLGSLITDVFDIGSMFVQIQVEHCADEHLLVFVGRSEILLGHNHEVFPVTRAHTRGSQELHERYRVHEVLGILVGLEVGLGPTHRLVQGFDHLDLGFGAILKVFDDHLRPQKGTHFRVVGVDLLLNIPDPRDLQ